jgi:hypothetical protein
METLPSSCRIMSAEAQRFRLVSPPKARQELARKHVPLIQWNRHLHDHEVGTGRVKVLDVSPEEAKTIAEKAAGTDRIIFELWQDGAVVPDGQVTFPT